MDMAVRAQDGADAERPLRLVRRAALVGLGLGLATRLAGIEQTSSGTLCPFRRVTGLPCPFCGGTRAAASLAHGDVIASIRWNPLVAVLVVVGLVAWAPRPIARAGFVRAAHLAKRAGPVPIVSIATALLLALWTLQLFRLGPL
jgi:hypothetical protein